MELLQKAKKNVIIIAMAKQINQLVIAKRKLK